MRCVLQRVKEAWVKVEKEEVARIEKGLLLLVGFGKGEKQENLAKVARKISHLRIFSNGEKEFQHALLTLSLPCLVVSNFTLYGSLEKGNRPDFAQAAPFQEAELLFQAFLKELRQQGLKIHQGIFGKTMEVGLINDGPVTFFIERS